MTRDDSDTREELLERIRTLTGERDDARAELSRSRLLRKLVDSIPHAIFGKDLKGRFNFVNRHYCKVLGKCRTEILGKTDFDVHPRKQAEMYRADDRQVMSTGETLTQVEEFARLDGQTDYIRVIKAPVRDGGETTGILGAFWDITDRMEIIHALAEATKKAQEASTAKSEFLNVMSHELRTPLNSVMGIADVLRETGLNAEQHSLLNTLHDAGNQLTILIENVLDITRIESSRLLLSSEAVDISDILERSVDVMRSQAGRKGLALLLERGQDSNQTLLCDPNRLHQILVNLLGNAIKFTEQGEIRLRVEPPDSGGMVRIIVEDSGIGIPEEMLDSVFAPFTQVDSSTTRIHGGAGLSLSIAYRLARLMKGTISLHQRPEGGTRAVLALPAATD